MPWAAAAAAIRAHRHPEDGELGPGFFRQRQRQRHRAEWLPRIFESLLYHQADRPRKNRPGAVRCPTAPSCPRTVAVSKSDSEPGPRPTPSGSSCRWAPARRHFFRSHHEKPAHANACWRWPKCLPSAAGPLDEPIKQVPFVAWYQDPGRGALGRLVPRSAACRPTNRVSCAPALAAHVPGFSAAWPPACTRPVSRAALNGPP